MHSHEIEDKWYFAYGSNLDTEQMAKRTGKIREARRAQLAGYRLLFNKRGSDGTGKANIAPDDTHVVWGIVYLCDERAFESLDQYEGVAGGHYYRKTVNVSCDSGEVLDAVAYIAGESFITSPLMPTPEYLQKIVNGAQSHGLPSEYIREVEQSAQIGKMDIKIKRG